MAETLSRKQACQRLIRSAIKGFVNGDEPLATHLTIQSAFRVCRDIVKKRNPAEDWFETVIVPERRREWMAAQTRIANFLKHADKNAADEIEVHGIVDLNEHEIMLAASYYEQAFPTSRDPYMRAYMVWYFLRYPDVLEEGGLPAGVPDFRTAINLGETWAGLQELVAANGEAFAEIRASSPGLDW